MADHAVVIAGGGPTGLMLAAELTLAGTDAVVAARSHGGCPYDGAWELPVVGEVPAPPAALIRPDGYVAWAGELKDPALPKALAAWFGAT